MKLNWHNVGNDLQRAAAVAVIIVPTGVTLGLFSNHLAGIITGVAGVVTSGLVYLMSDNTNNKQGA